MNKLEGLKIIAKLKLPHPDWEVVKESQELKKFHKIKAPVGWTIRSFLEDTDYAKRLPFTNWLPKRKVQKTLERFKKKLGKKAVFVVYPSWKFKKSGTILISKKIILEGVKGPITDLSRGKRCDASYIFSFNKKPIIFGDKKFLKKKEISFFLKNIKKILKRNIVLEWSYMIPQNKIIFHDMIGMKNLTRKILNDYK